MWAGKSRWEKDEWARKSRWEANNGPIKRLNGRMSEQESVR